MARTICENSPHTLRRYCLNFIHALDLNRPPCCKDNLKHRRISGKGNTFYLEEGLEVKVEVEKGAASRRGRFEDIYSPGIYPFVIILECTIIKAVSPGK